MILGPIDSGTSARQLWLHRYLAKKKKSHLPTDCVTSRAPAVELDKVTVTPVSDAMPEQQTDLSGLMNAEPKSRIDESSVE
jgi:hypothetical protein